MTLTFDEPRLFDVKVEELHEIPDAKLDRLIALAKADHKAKSLALKKASEAAVASYELLFDLEDEFNQRVSDLLEDDEPLGILIHTAEVDDVW